MHATQVGDSYSTLKEARDAGRELVEHGEYTELVVKSKVLRGHNTDVLALISRPEPESSNVTLSVTTKTPKSGAPITGYACCFDVHS
ncbi:hypothetical protein [Gulosibacter sediminis]|uniref:hypothetical protein n=1 Tax=Gulosibacter sediminis TaxID=1729695 RepID=UPI0024AE1E3C|nr:hypothetical protein [Gulosibacter sediminis]